MPTIQELIEGTGDVVPCGKCRARGPTAWVEMTSLVGLFPLCKVFETEAQLCRSCVNEAFLEHLTRSSTLGLLGWGFVAWPFTNANNGVRCLLARRKLRREEASLRSR